MTRAHKVVSLRRVLNVWPVALREVDAFELEGLGTRVAQKGISGSTVPSPTPWAEGESYGERDSPRDRLSLQASTARRGNPVRHIARR